jgi:hypothetical protein
MLGALGKIRRRFDWDVMVGVTDLPIRFEGRTLVVEVADWLRWPTPSRSCWFLCNRRQSSADDD